MFKAIFWIFIELKSSKLCRVVPAVKTQTLNMLIKYNKKLELHSDDSYYVLTNGLIFSVYFRLVISIFNYWVHRCFTDFKVNLFVYVLVFCARPYQPQKYKVVKTCTEEREREREEEMEKEMEIWPGRVQQHKHTALKQLRGVASGVRTLFLVGPHGKQTVLIKSPLLVRTWVH